MFYYSRKYHGYYQDLEILWHSLEEVVEHACGMATLQMGEFVPNVSNGIDTYSIREPLGVCAGICPFNFPAMIPLWVCHLSVLFRILILNHLYYSIYILGAMGS